MPRYIKIQEFPAHSAAVNCAKIGRKSSGVLVTGGEDKKVNLWTIGTQSRTLSLAGHQTAVESVCFDTNEEVVAAGAVSGSIKMFDLEQAKVTKSLPGHKSNVTCLDFSSSFGLLSGSMDTNIKLWDIRCKDASMTCKGHSSGVRHVKFSPDGKWVASGSDKGEVKIHDLTTGRVVQEFGGPGTHTNSITGLEFHPQEYLMATSSADKTVKVWDLDTMCLLETTPPETTGVRALAFHPDGRCLFSALQDGLRVWQWEPPPALQYDNVDVPWTKVSDMVVMKEKNKLVGCSFNQTFVGLWVVDLKDVRPFGSWAGDDAARGGAYMPANAYDARSSGSAGGNAPNLQDFALRRGQFPTAGRNESLEGLHKGMQQMGQDDRRASNNAAVGRSASGSMGAGADRRYPSNHQSEVSTSIGQPPVGRQPSQPAMPAPVMRSSSGTQCAPPSPERAMPPRPPAAADGAGPSHRGGMVSVGVGVGDSLFKGQVEPGGLSKIARDAASQPPLPPARALSQGRGLEQAGVGPQSALEHVRASGSAGAMGRPPAAGLSDVEVITGIVSKSDSTHTMLLNRLNIIRTMGGFIKRGDLKGAMTAARRNGGDPAAAADALQAALQSPKFGNLITPDAMAELAPVLETILALPDDVHVQVAVEIGTIMCRATIPWIIETLAAGNGRMVDIAAEQRKSKAERARLAMMGLQNRYLFVARQRPGTPMASRAADIADQLSKLL